MSMTCAWSISNSLFAGWRASKQESEKCNKTSTCAILAMLQVRWLSFQINAPRAPVPYRAFVASLDSALLLCSLKSNCLEIMKCSRHMAIPKALWPIENHSLPVIITWTGRNMRGGLSKRLREKKNGTGLLSYPLVNGHKYCKLGIQFVLSARHCTACKSVRMQNAWNVRELV